MGSEDFFLRSFGFFCFRFFGGRGVLRFSLILLDEKGEMTAISCKIVEFHFDPCKTFRSKAGSEVLIVYGRASRGERADGLSKCTLSNGNFST